MIVQPRIGPGAHLVPILVLVLSALGLREGVARLPAELGPAVVPALGLLWISAAGLLWALWRWVSLLSLRYHLDRNALTVHWVGGGWQIPLRDLEQWGPVDLPRGISLWPPGAWRQRGLWLGAAEGSGIQLVTRQGRRIWVTPADPEAFLRELVVRKEMGPTRETAEARLGPAWLRVPYWRRRTNRLLWLGNLGAVWGMELWLLSRGAALQGFLPLHFNALGEPDWIGPADRLLRLPAFAAALWVGNVLLGWVLDRESPRAATLLNGVGLGVSLLFWMAARWILEGRLL